MATKNYLSETGLATLWSQINKKCSKYLTEIPVATTTTIGGVKSGEGLSLSTDGTLSVVKEAKKSETFVVSSSKWSGSSAPYTATITLTNSYDSDKTVILSHATYAATSSDLEAYNAAARARIAVRGYSGSTLNLIAFGIKPQVDIQLFIAEV